jgi:RNA polymerase sigma-70 factor (ECF subfamily)
MDDRDIRWQAVERAYREHADDVYKVALAILRDPDAAVDVTHDTFARAFDRWHQYDANRPLRAWLHGIVSHAALDALRRRRVRTVAVPAIGRVRETEGSGSFEGDPAPRVAERDLVADVMAGLKPDARAALVLRHAYGYDYAEIARFLRTSPGNVGSILSRAHAALRIRLEVTGTEPSPSEPSTELPATGNAAGPPR